MVVELLEAVTNKGLIVVAVVAAVVKAVPVCAMVELLVELEKKESDEGRVIAREGKGIGM